MKPCKQPAGPRLALLAAVALLGGLLAYPPLGTTQGKQPAQPDMHKQPDAKGIGGQKMGMGMKEMGGVEGMKPEEMMKMMMMMHGTKPSEL